MGSSDKFSGGSELLNFYFSELKAADVVCVCDEANPGGKRHKWTQDVLAGSSEASREEPSSSGIVERGTRSEAAQ